MYWECGKGKVCSLFISPISFSTLYLPFPTFLHDPEPGLFPFPLLLSSSCWMARAWGRFAWWRSVRYWRLEPESPICRRSGSWPWPGGPLAGGREDNEWRVEWWLDLPGSWCSAGSLGWTDRPCCSGSSPGNPRNHRLSPTVTSLLYSDLHPDVPGQLSAGPDNSDLEISHSELMLVATSLLLTNFPRISGHQLLECPPHLPAGRSGLLLAPAPHQVHLPAGEDGGCGLRLAYLRC